MVQKFKILWWRLRWQWGMYRLEKLMYVGLEYGDVRELREMADLMRHIGKVMDVPQMAELGETVDMNAERIVFARSK